MTTEEYNERVKINHAEYVVYQLEHEVDYVIDKDDN